MSDSDTDSSIRSILVSCEPVEMLDRGQLGWCG